MAPIAGVAIVHSHDVAARGKTTTNSVPLALELVEIVAPELFSEGSNEPHGQGPWIGGIEIGRQADTPVADRHCDLSGVAR